MTDNDRHKHNNGKEKVFFCECCGRKLFKNGNGNGAGKEKKKEKALNQALEKISSNADWLKDWEGADPIEGPQKVREVVNIIEEVLNQIKEIDEENKKNGEPFYSAHHPLKRAVWGSNDYKIVLCSECHTRLERNITRVEAFILRIRPRVYAEVNTRFINSGGIDMTDDELTGIVFDDEIRLRKIPKDTLRSKIKSSLVGIVNSMKNMINERLRR